MMMASEILKANAGAASDLELAMRERDAVYAREFTTTETVEEWRAALADVSRRLRTMGIWG